MHMCIYIQATLIYINLAQNHDAVSFTRKYVQETTDSEMFLRILNVKIARLPRVFCSHLNFLIVYLI